MSAKTSINSVQRSRICVFENDKNTIFVTASVVATIFARIEGDFSALLTPGVPVFWISEQDIVQVVGEPSWDAVIHRLGFGLLSITFAEWTEENVLATVQKIFPTAELQNLQ